MKKQLSRRALVGLAAGAVIPATMPASARAVTHQSSDGLTVMSLNTWHGGSQVESGIDKIVTHVQQSGADVVALQETDTEATTKIAAQLGWNHTPTGWDIDVITGHTIENVDWESFPDSGGRAIAAEIKGVWVYSVHLDYTKYGPYNACFDNDSLPTIYEDEQSRKAQAADIVGWAGSSPAIIAGDFNTPSHQDWTEATADQHCGYVVDWPTTKVFWDARYWDSYREVNPDETRKPGNTWSPVYDWNEDRNEPEPQDRIDFVMYKGGTLDATSSTVYGGDSNWPSDHRAVLTALTL